MASITLTTTNGDISNTLAEAAGEAGYGATAAGVKALVIAHLRQVYQAQKQLQAQRSVAATLDATTSQAVIDGAAGIT